MQLPTQRLTIEQTRTGYWSVRRAGVHVAGATTRRGAEAERELLQRLARRAGLRRDGARALGGARR